MKPMLYLLWVRMARLWMRIALAAEPVARQRWLWRSVRFVATVAFVLAVPVYLVSASLKSTINSEALYSYGFDSFDVVQGTGIERDELLSAAAQIRRYFNDDQELITISVMKDGRRVPNLYGEREVLHMKDVKGLVRGVYGVKLWTGIYLLAFTLVALAVARWRCLPVLAKNVGRGGLLTLIVLLVFGIAAALGFERLFLEFHYLSFSNDLWILDPTRDYLIMMFPEDFFFYATMWVAVLTIAKALLLEVASQVVSRQYPALAEA